jgi:hypothetical protein
MARVTLMGSVEIVEKTPELVQRLLARHPDVARYVHFGDFHAMRFAHYLKARYISGFGSMSWIDGDVFACRNCSAVTSQSPPTAQTADSSGMSSSGALHGAEAGSSGESKSGQEEDPVASSSLTHAAIDHLNLDHASSMLDLVIAFAKTPTAPVSAKVVSIDRHGLTLDVTDSNGKVNRAIVRFGEPGHLQSPSQLRTAVMALCRRAREVNGEATA